MKILKFSLLYILPVTLIIGSCTLEEKNNLPEINSITNSSDELNPGDTLAINIDVFDPDGDDLFIHLKNTQAQIISDPGSIPVLIIPPYIEGLNSIDLEISDGKVPLKIQSEVNIFSFLYDDFRSTDQYWTESNCLATATADNVYITPTDTVDAIYSFDLHKNVEPPYAVHMDLVLHDDGSNFTFNDKYGIYLNFDNAGADTMIKALWLGIYPESTVKNWKVRVYADQGSSSQWVTLDANSTGMSGSVSRDFDVVNSAKVVIEEDNTLTIFVNNQEIYSSLTLANQYLSGGQSAKLILEQVGMRTTKGNITLDNVFVSNKTGLLTNELF